MAMAGGNGGLSQLAGLNRVIVAQSTTFMSGNKYVVTDMTGEVIFYAKEDMNVIGALFQGKNRQFTMDLCDRQHHEVIKLRRPYTFGADKMEVFLGSQLASVVRQQHTFMKPLLHINDANDRPVYRVKGPAGVSGEADFELQTYQDKRRIGLIRKTWGGFLREMFTKSDQFQVSFPGDLDVRYKAAAIGTALLIDFLYYEN